jgi:hypothetical protein
MRETSDRHGKGSALNNPGVALREAGRLEEAITAHQDAVTIYRETADRRAEGSPWTVSKEPGRTLGQPIAK